MGRILTRSYITSGLYEKCRCSRNIQTIWRMEQMVEKTRLLKNKTFYQGWEMSPQNDICVAAFKKPKYTLLSILCRVGY